MLLENLEKTYFIRRYKRFLMDLKRENGEIITVYTPNTGSMQSIFQENSIVYISKSNNKNRKLKYTAELVENLFNNQIIYIFINTILANYLVFEAIQNRNIKEFANYDSIAREITYGKDKKSRIDILLKTGIKEIFIEVKNATLYLGNNILAFPDAPSKRASKHVEELVFEAQNVNKLSYLFFLVSRTDVKEFTIAKKIDPLFYQKVKEAQKFLNLLAYKIKVIKEQKGNLYNFNIVLNEKIKINL